MSRPAIFLDRDGVIVVARHDPGTPVPPSNIQDAEIPDGVPQALATLRDLGYALVVVTNQPDIARGSATRATVDAINAFLCESLLLDAVYVCDHDGDTCPCRKPRPGMILDATRDLDLDLERSWLIGDRWVDIAAGRAAGVSSILLERVYSWACSSPGAPPEDLSPDFSATTLAGCVRFIEFHSAAP